MHGRDEELAVLVEALTSGSERWITLSGPGGVGKTTLAMHVAAVLADVTDVRVIVLELADVATVERVMPMLEAECNVARADGESPWRTLVAALGSRRTLVVVDNMEHLRDAGPALVELLVAVPTMQVLVTSRTPVRVAPERVVRVPTLSAPEPDASAEALVVNPVVRLFMDVATARGISAPFPDEELRGIAELGRLVGGLPLAIELIASRSTVMKPTAMVQRLVTHGLLATAGAGTSDRPARQRDLSASVSWSVGLLDEQSHLTLRAATAFAGWFRADELLDVVATRVPDETVRLDAFGAVVDAHLLESDEVDGQACFRLHPVVREALMTKAEDVGPAASVNRADFVAAHDEALARLVTTSATRLANGSTRGALPTLRRRYDDLLAASGRAEARQDTVALGTFALGLAPLWGQSGESGARSAGLSALAARLATSSTPDPVLAAQVTAWSVLLRVESDGSGDADDALFDLLDDALGVVLGAGDDSAVVLVTSLAARTTLITGHFTRAQVHLEHGLRAALALGDERLVSRVQLWAGMLAFQEGRPADAAVHAAASWSAARRLGQEATAVYAAVLLADVEPELWNIDLRDACRRAAEVSDDSELVTLAPVVGTALLKRDDARGAAAATARGIRASHRRGQINGLRMSLVIVIFLATRRGDVTVAARLYGAVRESVQMLRHAFSRGSMEAFDLVIGALQHKLGAEVYEREVALGSALQWNDAVELALRYADDTAAEDVETVGWSTPLTDREEQVLGCLTAGMSNKDIARTLGITVKTAMHHTSSVYRKLEVSGRAEAAAWGVRHGVPLPATPTSTRR